MLYVLKTSFLKKFFLKKKKETHQKIINKKNDVNFIELFFLYIIMQRLIGLPYHRMSYLKESQVYLEN